MAALQLIITDAGRNAMLNAEGDGTNAIKITQIALGHGTEVDSPSSATALQGEFARIDAISGEQIAPDMLHIAMYDYSESSYTASEVGVYLEDGTLFALYAQNNPFIEKAEVSHLYITFDVKFDTALTANISFGDLSLNNPPATETIMGVAKIATDADIVAGEDDQKMVTSKKLASGYYLKSETNTVDEIDQKDSQVKSAVETAVNPKLLPAGVVLPFAGTEVPEYFLECNGAYLSREVYNDLFDKIGTTNGSTDETNFRLPDLRGEFIRGLDNGRGIDAGRVAGSYQSDDFKSHNHSIGTYAAHYTNGSMNQGLNWWAGTNIKSRSEGGDETRPRNIAMMYCIKY